MLPVKIEGAFWFEFDQNNSCKNTSRENQYDRGNEGSTERVPTR